MFFILVIRWLCFINKGCHPLDPILSSVMEDPVLLPTSNTIVDRSTIRAHLLGDTRDPFSRAPLSMDMVEPGKAFDIDMKSIYTVL